MNTSPIQRMNPRHFRILDLCVLGRTNKQIAEELGMEQRQISIIIHSPNFQHEFAKRRAIFVDKQESRIVNADDEVTKILKESAIEAANRLRGSLDSIEESLQLKASTEILDRTGYQKKHSIVEQSSGPVIIINTNDASRLAKAIELDNLDTLKGQSIVSEADGDKNGSSDSVGASTPDENSSSAPAR